MTAILSEQLTRTSQCLFVCQSILLLSGPSAPGSVATRLDVSVEVSSVDQGVDAAAEHGRQQHEVRDQGAHLGHQVITKVHFEDLLNGNKQLK